MGLVSETEYSMTVDNDDCRQLVLLLAVNGRVFREEKTIEYALAAGSRFVLVENSFNMQRRPQNRSP